MDRQRLNSLIDDYALAYAEDHSYFRETGDWTSTATDVALQALNEYLDSLSSREEVVLDCLNNFHLPEDCYEGIYED